MKENNKQSVAGKTDRQENEMNCAPANVMHQWTMKYQKIREQNITQKMRERETRTKIKKQKNNREKNEESESLKNH